MNQEHFEAVKETLKLSCGVREKVLPESRLVEDLELDSMGMMALAIGLENRFKINLGEDPDSPPVTVKDVVELLSARLLENV